MKLDDIDKKDPFKVPDRYFDELPERIQSRIRRKGQSRWSWGISFPSVVRLALPVAAVILVAIYFGFPGKDTPAETLSYREMIDDVSTEDLIAYLENSEISAEEIIETVDVEALELELEEEEESWIIEDEMDDEMMNAIIEEYNLDV